MSPDPHHNLWQHSSHEAITTQPLGADATVDLVVIGGGFTGCSAALEAARSGARTMVLEGRTIGFGGSGRNVGLVNAGLWLPPEKVRRAIGAEAGNRLLQHLSTGPDKVFDLIAREGIDCEATQDGTLHLAHAPAAMAELQERQQQSTEFAAGWQVLDAAETARRTGSAAFHGALLNPGAGTVQPLAYCRGLARAALRAGADIHEHSPVSAVRHTGDVWEVIANGHTVRARSLLMATNAYQTGIHGSTPPAFATVHFSQFATAPLPAPWRARILAGGEGCWDTALVMTSLRVDREGRLIVGGMGNADGAGGHVHATWARRKLRQLYPDLGDLPFVHHWHGRISMTADHVPKLVSLGPSGLSAFGYSGRGIAPGTVFGSAAATALLQDQMDALPLPVLSAYGEALTGLKEAYYELGATLTHAVRT